MSGLDACMGSLVESKCSKLAKNHQSLCLHSFISPSQYETLQGFSVQWLYFKIKCYSLYSWRWLLLRLSKCQSPTTFYLRTTLTWVISQDKQLILVGSNHVLFVWTKVVTKSLLSWALDFLIFFKELAAELLAEITKEMLIFTGSQPLIINGVFWVWICYVSAACHVT